MKAKIPHFIFSKIFKQRASAGFDHHEGSQVSKAAVGYSSNSRNFIPRKQVARIGKSD